MSDPTPAGAAPRDEAREVERVTDLLREVLDFKDRSRDYVESIAWYLVEHGVCVAPAPWVDRRIAELEAALVKAAIPLEVLVMDEAASGPIREISPTLYVTIREGLAALRAAARAPGREPT